MEQQKHYVSLELEGDEYEEENDSNQLKSRYSRQLKDSTVSMGKGNQEQEEEEEEEEAEKVKSNYEDALTNKGAYTAAITGLAFREEDDKESDALDGVKVEYFISKDEKLDVKEEKLYDEIETSVTTQVEDESISAIQVVSREEEEEEEEEDIISLEHSVEKTNVLAVDVHLIEENDQELTETEFDVEKVIERQNTHDLFCPNCNSCITKRVILRRRKPRRIGRPHKPKPVIVSPDQSDDALISSKVTPSLPAIEGRKPRLFRCLSCLSIFFPPDDSETDDISKDKPLVQDFPDTPPTSEGGVGLEPVETIGENISSEISGSRTPDDTIISGHKDEKQSHVAVVGDITEGEVGFKPVAPVESIGNILPTELPDGKKPEDNISSSEQEPQKSNVGVVGNITGGDVIITVAPPESRGDEPGAREGNEWDILKSIVYGGLVESITSLGIVSSAAAAGATTLNILAMGLANLIGGLFILGHNLRELKNEQSEGSSSRYQKLLGRRENFSVHATLAVISFLFFGLLPPIIYGFSFRKSDNRDLKLAAVLGTSIICIILLAIAKCRVKEPPKSYIKTTLYYISTGVVASCVSYLAGELIKKLLEKLGWFDSTSTSVVATSFTDSKPMQSMWASY